jgi:hypothetical protein
LDGTGFIQPFREAGVYDDLAEQRVVDEMRRLLRFNLKEQQQGALADF